MQPERTPQPPQMTYPWVLRREKTLAKEIYDTLIDLFGTEGTWTPGWFACQRDGRSCSFASKDAVSFDLIGAIGRICLAMKDRDVPPRLLSKAQSLVTWSMIDAVWRAGYNVPHRESPLVQWNDNVCKNRLQALGIVKSGSTLLEEKVEVH